MDAVIVDTVRTPLCKSWKGAMNMTHGATLGGHVVKTLVERSGIDPKEVEDVVMGCASPEGATGQNIARQIAIRAGLPVTVSGLTVNRFCSSGLQTVALASQRLLAGEDGIYVAGGVESISCVQNQMNTSFIEDPWLTRKNPRSIGRCCKPPRPSLSDIKSRERRKIVTVPRVKIAQNERRMRDCFRTKLLR